METSISVIIPAHNEAQSIGKVLAEIPSFVREVIVVDNNSTDETSEVAKKFNAKVMYERNLGYGNACLAGMRTLDSNPPEIVVFLDGDYSDYPKEMSKLIDPIKKGVADFVIGARDKSIRESGSMTLPQVFGNWLACVLMKLLYQSRYTDLGPFRAIRWETLKSYKMRDRSYGWTIEMQLKSLHHKTPYTEIPVKYRTRIGRSKISGTIRGTVLAGFKILGWIGKFYFSKK
ncbi:MAG: glycosyltransferase family 2 protein [Flavobacteriaceae bacterium]|nr:glycosyltransferase family 2 protein [Flavobacteriaceae bacterium]MCY4217457.1 glycosyltransferase family 2 protein [Flavobacteriaceae bacterium]MCY4254225.1 glycosyltransferase family 2 protein [Flavobacteriaceae bacterium]